MSFFAMNTKLTMLSTLAFNLFPGAKKLDIPPVWLDHWILVRGTVRTWRQRRRLFCCQKWVACLPILLFTHGNKNRQCYRHIVVVKCEWTLRALWRERCQKKDRIPILSECYLYAIFKRSVWMEPNVQPTELTWHLLAMRSLNWLLFMYHLAFWTWFSDTE